jgi:hypothetical protein
VKSLLDVKCDGLGGIGKCLDAEEFVWEWAVLGVELWRQVSGEQTYAKGEELV